MNYRITLSKLPPGRSRRPLLVIVSWWHMATWASGEDISSHHRKYPMHWAGCLGNGITGFFPGSGYFSRCVAGGQSVCLEVWFSAQVFSLKRPQRHYWKKELQICTHVYYWNTKDNIWASVSDAYVEGCQWRSVWQQPIHLRVLGCLFFIGGPI